MSQSPTPQGSTPDNPDANTASNAGGQAAGKPSDPSPAQPTSPTAAPSLSEFKAEIKELSGNKINFANILNKFKVYLGDNNQGLLSVGLRQFTLNDIWRVRKEKQEEIAGLFVADPTEIERLRLLLAEKRVLILSGEAGIGKTTTAIYLRGLVTEHGDADVQAATQETYLIPTLNRYVKIDLNEICELDKVPSNRCVIFKNALAGNNQDLLGFFAQLNPISLVEFTNKLRKDNSYLIFTVTTSEAVQFQANLVANDLHHKLSHLNGELLLQGLKRKLAQLEQSPRLALERLKHLQEPEQQQLMVVRLKTMPRIVSFVEYYLRDSGETAVEVNLDEAIRRFEDIRYWFQRDLTGDFEAWCFTLSLGLAHCLNDSQGVSWVDFDYLRRTVWHCLKRDPELFPPRFSLNDQPVSEFSEKAPILIDDGYLEKSRAVILKDQNTLADLIRFSDDSYSQKLWEILLKHHRRILTLLLPRLCEQAEDQGEKYDAGQRTLCARVIGRIGEIDPERVSLALMSRWIYSEDVRHRPLIGALYQGILASRHERYRNYFLDILKSLTESNSVDGDNEEEKNRLLTAIAVYSQIGSYDLSLAMKGLGKIAREKLVDMMENVQRIERLIESTQNEFAQPTSLEEAIELLLYQDMLSDLAGRIYAQQGSTFMGVQYTLCSLCVNTVPISVFKELRHWIETSNQATGALVALMFFMKGGIAATLGASRVEISNEESATAERKTCNPIIDALTSGQDTVREMARFLATIFESFSARFTFPKEFVRYLRESFLFYLKTWIEEALPIEPCRKAMENLLIELMQVHQGVLFETVYQLLSSPEFLKKYSDSKKHFVNAVLWQRPSS